MNVLLVEDETHKLDELVKVFHPLDGAKTFQARSVRSAIDFFRDGGSVGLMVLDMSLPTFDIDENESGGTPQPFGGIEILRYLSRISAAIPTIVFTGYPAFEDDRGIVTLSALEDEMREEFNNAFLGIVQYSAFSDEWVAKLKAVYFKVKE